MRIPSEGEVVVVSSCDVHTMTPVRGATQELWTIFCWKMLAAIGRKRLRFMLLFQPFSEHESQTSGSVWEVALANAFVLRASILAFARPPAPRFASSLPPIVLASLANRGLNVDH